MREFQDIVTNSGTEYEQKFLFPRGGKLSNFSEEKLNLKNENIPEKGQVSKTCQFLDNSNTQLYQCQYCDRPTFFGSKRDLEAHVEKTHGIKEAE